MFNPDASPAEAVPGQRCELPRLSQLTCSKDFLFLTRRESRRFLQTSTGRQVVAIATDIDDGSKPQFGSSLPLHSQRD